MKYFYFHKVFNLKLLGAWSTKPENPIEYLKQT